MSSTPGDGLSMDPARRGDLAWDMEKGLLKNKLLHQS